ncbi:MAG: ComEA family DNA-binding protein [Candidatus Hydrogenedentota bacterium]
MLSRFMTRREQFVLFFVACAIMLGSVAIFWTRDTDEDAVLIPAEDSQTVTEVPPPVLPTEKLAPTEIAVSVQGAVRLPGLYTFTTDDRVQDAIQAAGGLAADADSSSVNLAARLVDATTLSIPARNDDSSVQPIATYAVSQPRSPDAPITTGTTPGKININTATLAQLETLPGIGPSYAQAIINRRAQAPFRRVDEITEVRGIGPKQFEGIRDLIAVQ